MCTSLKIVNPTAGSKQVTPGQARTTTGLAGPGQARTTMSLAGAGQARTTTSLAGPQTCMFSRTTS